MVNHITIPTASHLIVSSLTATDASTLDRVKQIHEAENVPLFDKNGNKLVLALPKSACWE